MVQREAKNTCEQPSYCIVGAGAIGLTLAAWLSQQSEKVSVLAKAEQLPQLTESFPKIEGPAWCTAKQKKISFLHSERLPQLPKSTYFLITVKANQVLEVARFLRPHLQPTHTVILLSNGLGVFAEMMEELGREIPAVRALLSFGARRELSGSIFVAGEPKFLAASFPQHQSSLERFVRALERNGGSCQLAKNVAHAEWKKTLLNLVVNSLATLLNSPNGVLLKNSALHPLIHSLLSEIRQVAAAEGFELQEYSSSSFLCLIEPHAENINSTLADLRQGKQTEFEYIFGRFLRIADSYDISCPHMRTVASLLKAFEQSNILSNT